MSGPTTARVPGHGLLYEGRCGLPWQAKDPNGLGTGICSCGVLSPTLPNTAARKRWHREHKRAVLRERGEA